CGTFGQAGACRRLPAMSRTLMRCSSSPAGMRLAQGLMTRRVGCSTCGRTASSTSTRTTTYCAESRRWGSRTRGGCYLLDTMTLIAMFGMCSRARGWPRCRATTTESVAWAFQATAWHWPLGRGTVCSRSGA
ncbi:hypothetical protein GGF48_005578, partial [Coemansia sp. RSA 921]